MIICDSNVLVGLVDQTDHLNKRARKDLERHISNEFLVTESVLSETLFLLPAAVHRARLGQILVDLDVHIASGFNHRDFITDVFAWLAKYAEHQPDWADAHIAVLCQRHKNYRVWTYDSEFKKISHRPDGTAIPLLIKSL